MRFSKTFPYGGLLLGLGALAFLRPDPVDSQESLPTYFQPPVAVDENPDPNIVEVSLTAQESTINFGGAPTSNVFTFNGMIPGPTLEGKVGDLLVVNFTNQLSENTTIHWHGVDVPANMDGSNISQGAVPPGGTFRYQFRLLRASTFWYHPHIRTHAQVEKGLYGTLIVRDEEEDRSLGIPNKDHVLVLDDIQLDENGQITEEFPREPLSFAQAQLNGKIGNVLLVNGQVNPSVEVAAGVPQRLRLVNVANARFMRISIRGHRMFRIGGDGGLLENPISIPPITTTPDPDPSHGVLLTPGERADVIFTPTGNAPIEIEWHDWPRGRHTTFFRADGSIGLGRAADDGRRPPVTMMTMIPVGNTTNPEFIPPSRLSSIEPFNAQGARTIRADFGHTLPEDDGNVFFFAFANGDEPLPFFFMNADNSPTARVGETIIWEIHNMTAGDHNFHLHGFPFQVIDTQFLDSDNPANNFRVPAPFRELKDTVLLPKRTGARPPSITSSAGSRSIVRVAVRIDDTGREGQVQAFGRVPGENTSGGWLFHCHLLEHALRGMMGFLQVFN